MTLDDYDSLHEMWNEFCREAMEIDAQIHYNLRCIREADAYLGSFLKSETEDFKVFSPRRAEVIHKAEIDEANRKKSFHEGQNRELYKKKDRLNERINRLEVVLDHQSRGFNFLKVQEEERQRIARDLHDTSLQNLAHLIHKIELCTMYIDKDPIQAKLELSVISKRLRGTIEDIRCTIFDLRPVSFDGLGIKESFEHLLAKINEDGRYAIQSEIEEIPSGNKLVMTAIYRVVQESINNIVKHAEADKIIFRCRMAGEKCVIGIEDNGKGFSEESVTDPADGGRHFGLSLMRESVGLLNGSFEIDSGQGRGTRIAIEIPVENLENQRGT